jgi:hypothetical protein
MIPPSRRQPLRRNAFRCSGTSAAHARRRSSIRPRRGEAPSDSIGFGCVNDIGHRVVAALGERAARELLEVLERSDADRAALIARLYVRDDA